MAPFDRLLTSSCQLAFHSNYGFSMYCFRDKARCSSKIVIFHTPPAFDAPVVGNPSEILSEHFAWIN